MTLHSANDKLNSASIKICVVIEKMKRCNHRVHTEWQRPLSGVHSIMMEKIAQSDEGWGCTPIPFHHIYHHVQSCSVRFSLEWRHTPPIFHVYPYILCGCNQGGGARHAWLEEEGNLSEDGLARLIRSGFTKGCVMCITTILTLYWIRVHSLLDRGRRCRDDSATAAGFARSSQLSSSTPGQAVLSVKSHPRGHSPPASQAGLHVGSSL